MVLLPQDVFFDLLSKMHGVKNSLSCIFSLTQSLIGSAPQQFEGEGKIIYDNFCRVVPRQLFSLRQELFEIMSIMRDEHQANCLMMEEVEGVNSGERVAENQIN